MPSAFAHPVIPLALGLALGSGIVPTRLLLAGAVASVIPDLDSIGFLIGVPYEHALGHRGASHSFAFALLLGALAALASPVLRCRRWTAFWFVSASCISHGLLDMMTSGGLGVALLWPLSADRLWLPIRPIRVSPINIRQFFSARGITVLTSELVWVGLPAAVLGSLTYFARKFSRKTAAPSPASRHPD